MRRIRYSSWLENVLIIFIIMMILGGINFEWQQSNRWEQELKSIYLWRHTWLGVNVRRIQYSSWQEGSAPSCNKKNRKAKLSLHPSQADSARGKAIPASSSVPEHKSPWPRHRTTPQTREEPASPKHPTRQKAKLNSARPFKGNGPKDLDERWGCVSTNLQVLQEIPLWIFWIVKSRPVTVNKLASSKMRKL